MHKNPTFSLEPKKQVRMRTNEGPQMTQGSRDVEHWRVTQELGVHIAQFYDHLLAYERSPLCNNTK